MAVHSLYRVGEVVTDPDAVFDFTLDPDEARGEKLVSDVFDHAEKKRPGYEVEFIFDPDGYFFGKLRRWKFTVESRDPRFSPRSFIRSIVEQVFAEAVESGETTGWVADRAKRILVPQLGKRDRVVVRSHDGERHLVYEQPPFRFR